MMGLQAAPEQLFYHFCLEDHVPVDHILREDRPVPPVYSSGSIPLCFSEGFG